MLCISYNSESNNVITHRHIFYQRMAYLIYIMACLRAFLTVRHRACSIINKCRRRQRAKHVMAAGRASIFRAVRHACGAVNKRGMYNNSARAKTVLACFQYFNKKRERTTDGGIRVSFQAMSRRERRRA